MKKIVLLRHGESAWNKEIGGAVGIIRMGFLIRMVCGTISLYKM